MADDKKPGQGQQGGKPDEKKENKTLKLLKKVFKVVFCIVFFYVVLGYFVSWLFVRFYRWFYSAIAALSSSAKKMAIIKFFFLFFLILLNIFIFAVVVNTLHYQETKEFTYQWFTIKFPWINSPFAPEKGGILSDEDLSFAWMFGVFSFFFSWQTFIKLLYLYTIMWFAISNITVFIIIGLFEKKITKFKQLEEIKIQEAEYNGYEHKPKHPYLDAICKLIGYTYQEKIQHRIDLVTVKNKIAPTLGNGMLVSKKNRIIFYHQFWKDHAAFIGAAKTGVTNDILNWVIAASYIHFPVIYIDSDGDSNTFNKVKSIANNYGSKFTYFNFFEQEHKYNPLYGKTYEEAAEMITYAFLGKDEIENYGLNGHAKIIQDIFALMKIKNDKIDFKTLLLYLDKTFLTKEFTQEPLAKPLIEDEDIGKILSKLSKDIKNFNTVFSKHISSDDTSDVYTIADIITPSKIGPMLYILIPNKLGKEMKKTMKRLLFKDILISSFIGKQDRAARKINVLLCFNSIFELFYNPNEVSSSFAQLTANNFCLGIDLRGYTFSTGDMDVIKEGILCCKTLFIHKNNDKNINTILTDVLATSRTVSLNFQVDEAKWKNKKDKSLEALNKTIKNAEEARKKIISSLGTLQIGELYFKTLHHTHIERFQKNSPIEEIIYHAPITAQIYTDTLASAK